MSHFTIGEWVTMREVWNGQTWELRRGIIIRDDDTAIGLYTPPRTQALIAMDADGKRLRIPPPEWSLAETATPIDRHFLAIHPPGAGHSILCIWDGEWRLLHWYINLETDMARTEAGFEYTEHMLDVIVEPDLQSWHWKDEDELAEAIVLGLFTTEEARGFYSEGRCALDWLLARRAPYDEPWDAWRPPDGWTVADAPAEWQA
ncbi:MAG: DUF402 domain-containing protein [Dehalococcoidia bacterium]